MIDPTIPEARLARYRALAGSDSADVERFYLWARDVSLALFADIGLLEVSLRSAMAAELTAGYGNEWYASSDLFDDDAARSIAVAWNVNGLQALKDAATPDLELIEGKLVAGLMFGLWVQLLGRGSWAGRKPLRRRRIYDTLLWQPALSKAFPNASSRREVERNTNAVRATRNRVAHHEHIVWGIPLPGQSRRLSVSEAHQAVLKVASFISNDLATWIDSRSVVGTALTNCPVDRTQLAL